jgi:hypothetical protein
LDVSSLSLSVPSGFRLFVDLDGVLADFDSGVLSLTGMLPHEQSPAQMWSALARADRFYERLDWMSDGHQLWESLRHLNPTILTGLPRGSWAEPQKRAWCARELGPDVQVITCWSREKAARAQERLVPGEVAVLIDDRESLAESWEAAGGVFIHHQTAARTLSHLSAACRDHSARA